MLSPDRLHIRAAFFRAIRQFFFDQGFLEVDTLLRQPVLIPERNIQPFDSEGWFLQTSPELSMKRLLANGCDRIFQIAPCFRRGERGRLHLEEFSLLEWYRVGADYTELMEDCSLLLESVTRCLEEQWPEICRLSSPGSKWQRLSVAEAFRLYSPVALESALEGDNFDEIIVEHVEPNLGNDQPCFLYDYPASMASLARLKDDDPAVAERFELYIKGIELANGFSELVDAGEQRKRFEVELEGIGRDGEYSGRMPEIFLDDLAKLTSAAGIALGVDRLLMLLLGLDNVADVLAIPPNEM